VMLVRGAGVLIVALAATSAHAQQSSALSPLSAAVFEGGKALPTQWRTTEFAPASKAKGAPELKISLGGTMRGPDGLPVLHPDKDAAFEPEGFDVRVKQDWPAVRLDAGEQDLQITPQAEIAFSDAGPGAGAGATVSLEDKVAGKLGGLGVRDGRSFGDRGRWYLYAATSGRSVGLNVLRGAEGRFRREGWSTDGTSALVSDAQAGVGWRKGPMQASVGYMHREIKPKHGLAGIDTKDDDLVAVSFSFKPTR